MTKRWASVFLSMMMTVAAVAAEVVNSAQATASAVVTLTTNLSVETRLVSNNAATTPLTNFGPATAYPFPVPLWSFLAPKYLALSVASTAPVWELRVYTNNFATQPSVSTWGYQYGGLIGPVPDKVAMGWRASPSVVPGGPATGDPASGTGWAFLKDIMDVDDPTSLGDQSFTGANGYVNAAFGGPSYTRVVDPLSAEGSVSLPTPTSPFYIYFEADFANAPGAVLINANTVLLPFDQYRTTIRVDVVTP